MWSLVAGAIWMPFRTCSKLGLDGGEDLAEPGTNGRERTQHEQKYELWEHKAVAGASNGLGQMLRPHRGLMGEASQKQYGTWNAGLNNANQTEYHHHSYLTVRF